MAENPRPIKAVYDQQGSPAGLGEFTDEDALAVAQGGTGAQTAQAAVNTLTNASGATTGHVLAKDSDGNVKLKKFGHADLDGLTTGDPHTQYALADGSRAFTFPPRCAVQASSANQLVNKGTMDQAIADAVGGIDTSLPSAPAQTVMGNPTEANAKPISMTVAQAQNLLGINDMLPSSQKGAEDGLCELVDGKVPENRLPAAAASSSAGADLYLYKTRIALKF